MLKKRIIWIDIVRALGMLLIISGHSLANPMGHVGDFVYAVNVPIFFVLSGYLYHPQKLKVQCYKLFFNLLVPYLGTCLLIIITSEILNRIGPLELMRSYGPLTTVIKASFFGMGSNTRLIGTNYQMRAIGAIWFLLTLLWDSILFNILMRWSMRYSYPMITTGVFSFVMLILGFWLPQYGYFPWSINAAFIGIFFIWIGQLYKKMDLLNSTDIKRISLLIIGFGLWMWSVFTHVNFGLNIAFSNQPVISIISACGGTLSIIIGISWLDNLCKSKYLYYVSLYGRYSLAVLSVHIIDVDLFTFSAQLVNVMPLKIATLLIIIVHTLITIIGVFLYRKLPFIRNIFFNREFSWKFQERFK